MNIMKKEGEEIVHNCVLGCLKSTTVCPGGLVHPLALALALALHVGVLVIEYIRQVGGTNKGVRVQTEWHHSLH